MHKYLNLLLLVLLMGCSSSSKKLELEKPLAEKVNVGGQELVLVGTGIRIASKFGITAKIYKAGLYAAKPPKNAKDILESSQPKKVFMRFVYRISRSLLQEGWEDAYNHSCFLNCAQTKDALRDFKELLQGMKVGQTMSIDYLLEKVVVSIDDQKVGEVSSPDFSKNLFAVFIGERVIDEGLKDDLLSL